MESTRNTVCYGIRSFAVILHLCRTRKHMRWKSTESAGRQIPLHCWGNYQLPQSSPIRGRISSSIVLGNMWNGQPLTCPRYHCVTNFLNPGYSCSQKRAVWENLEAVLCKETQEGGGKFFLASAEQKLSDVKEHSAWRFILWCCCTVCMCWQLPDVASKYLPASPWLQATYKFS